MRTTHLSRAVIATATLATAATLTGAPATAAQTDLTREQVLTTAATLRLQQPSDAQWTASDRVVRGLLNRHCDLDADGGESFQFVDAEPVQAGQSADGFVAHTYVNDYSDGGGRDCYVAVVAAGPEGGFALKGTGSLDVPTSGVTPARSTSTPLSGPVTVVPHVSVPSSEAQSGPVTFTATGSADRTTSTSTTTRVAVKRTKTQRKRAKAVYVKRTAAAKRALDKALDRAGSSPTRRIAALQKYKDRRTADRRTYRAAIARSKKVTKTTTSTDSRPFSITAGGGPPV